MPETTPAGTLREAAALMRERAQKARAASAGPWKYQDGWIWDGIFERADVFGDDRAAFGEHAASWHPEAALAVANLLDLNATRAEDAGLPADGEWSHCDDAAAIDAALTVARAYLGRAESGGSDD